MLTSYPLRLRSPLHGCLAAVEFLQDTKLDDTQAELIEMIQSCASTLLDTLNHLLDFSKVNEHKSPNLRLGKHHKTHRLKHTQNTFGSSTDAYLCTIVQDVIEVSVSKLQLMEYLMLICFFLFRACILVNLRSRLLT